MKLINPDYVDKIKSETSKKPAISANSKQNPNPDLPAVDPKSKVRIGMPFGEVERLLDRGYFLEGTQILFNADSDKSILHTYCSSDNSSVLFRIETKDGIVTKFY